jgi:hypothetical protein
MANAKRKTVVSYHPVYVEIEKLPKDAVLITNTTVKAIYQSFDSMKVFVVPADNRIYEVNLVKVEKFETSNK